MPFCEQCGEEIGYLPFKCKYCGGTFCKKHRLPENHECTFELKHTPVVPTTFEERSPLYQDLGVERPRSRGSSRNGPRELKKYLKRQDKQKRQTYRAYRRNMSGPQMRTTNGTTFLMAAIIIFSLAALFVPEYLCLSSNSFLNYFFWTFLTAPFVNYSGIFGIFFLFILLFCFSKMLKNIELMFGTRFFLSVYLFCAFFTGLIYFIIWFLLGLVYPVDQIPPIGLASGALYGLISLMILFNLNRNMTFFAYFIPLRLKGKTIIILLILFSLIPGLLYGLFVHPTLLALYIPDIGGILAACLVFYVKFRPQNRRPQY